jgi:hypothetical protein
LTAIFCLLCDELEDEELEQEELEDGEPEVFDELPETHGVPVLTELGQTSNSTTGRASSKLDCMSLNSSCTPSSAPNSISASTVISVCVCVFFLSLLVVIFLLV